MIIKNHSHNKWHNCESKEQYDFVKQVNIGDIATVTNLGSISNGSINLISRRGINISTSWGDKFVKWTHVLEIDKEKASSVTKLKESGYIPMCPYGFDDCVCDCNYIKYHYPDWYREIGSPTECKHCEDGSHYDNEDK